MNSISYESEDIIQMPEIVSTRNTNQPLTTSTTMEDINATPRFNDAMRKFIEQWKIDFQVRDLGRIDDMGRNQKSLMSIYDNNPQQVSYSLVGIIGRNQRSQAFAKRLFLSRFPRPILLDTNATEIKPDDSLNYVTYETFEQFSPSIVLLTDSLPKDFEDLFPQNNQQILIDTREILAKTSSTIPGSYRAFGNLSNWEIEHGTQRIGVAIEQYSPSHLSKFIHELNCFPRGTFSLDYYSYSNQPRESFRNCLFPLISTMIIFTIYWIFAMMDDEALFVYRQASSITAATSITLLALVFFIKPLLELIQWASKKPNLNENMKFIRCWLQSRRYLVWYSLSFAFLHLLFLLFSKLDFDSIWPVLFGLLALILLIVLSVVHLPWISERLQWSEYHILTSYLGPFSLLLAFIHLYLHWNLHSDVFSLKFLSMILPLFVLILRLIIYGILYPIEWIRHRRLNQNRS